MKVLVIGGNGFIGRHVVAACGAGVVRGVRQPAPGDIACDLVRDIEPAAWAPRVAGMDAVINCAGLLHAPPETLHAVHALAPAAIAKACAQGGVPFVHVSVLGLERAADTPYFSSKRDGEAAVRRANPAAIIVRPSVVFGPDSPASRLMLLQARLPFLVLPAHTKAVAPVHVDDVAQLCLQLAGTLCSRGRNVDCVGQAEMSIADYVQALRCAGHRSTAREIRIPNQLMRVALGAASFCGASTLSPEVLDLMEHEHTGDSHTFYRWMHRAPRPVERFLRD